MSIENLTNEITLAQDETKDNLLDIQTQLNALKPVVSNILAQLAVATGSLPITYSKIQEVVTEGKPIASPLYAPYLLARMVLGTEKPTEYHIVFDIAGNAFIGGGNTINYCRLSDASLDAVVNYLRPKILELARLTATKQFNNQQ